MKKISFDMPDGLYEDMIKSIKYLNNDPTRHSPKWTISEYIRTCIILDAKRNIDIYERRNVNKNLI